MDEITLRLRITGRVQGVWFRGWTSEQARELGLRGWVRNEPDGSVVALVAGPRALVNQMVRLLHQGPPAARVEAVVSEASDEAPGEGFIVRR